MWWGNLEAELGLQTQLHNDTNCKAWRMTHQCLKLGSGCGTLPPLSQDLHTRCCQYFLPCSETSAACSTCPRSQLDSCVCHVPASDKSWGNQFELLKAVILRELAHFGTLQFCSCEVLVVMKIFFTTNNHLCSWISQLKAYNAFQKKNQKPGSSGSSIKPDFQSYVF